MVQLIFVHGVSVRKEPDIEAYEKSVRIRRDSFRSLCFKSTSVNFYDPYWGEHGARPDENLISIPKDSGVSLAIGEGLGGGGAADGNLDDNLLLQAARNDFGAVLNSLALELMDQTDDDADIALAEALADYAVSLDGDTADAAVSAPSWLGEIATDAQFLERLKEEISVAGQEGVELGLGSKLKSVGKKIGGSLLNLVDGPIEKLLRKVTPKLAIFLGDAFVYLKPGDMRDSIRTVVLDDVKAAATKARENDEKLVVVGHSMGANILFDIFGDPASMDILNAELGFDLKVDLFLSVGTQLGLFEELDLFANSQTGVKPARPAFIAHWWHVYNKMDVLSFGVEGVITGVRQFSVNTKANIVDAHSAYFRSPVFQKRLRKRMHDVGIIE